jgi:hypothetical protein
MAVVIGITIGALCYVKALRCGCAFLGFVSLVACILL